MSGAYCGAICGSGFMSGSQTASTRGTLWPGVLYGARTFVNVAGYWVLPSAVGRVNIRLRLKQVCEKSQNSL